MSILLDLQLASSEKNLPDNEQIRRWLETALSACADKGDAEVTVRLVDEQESASLNTQYRGREGSTNVLSFPSTLPDSLEPDFLGDIVICAPVVIEEAKAENKELAAHWAHLCVHGCLHLLGYDHIEDSDAEIMEQLESQILLSLGYPDPY